MRTEVIKLNEARNVTLTAYTQAAGGEFRNVPKRHAVLVLPGGGYQMCSEREADPVAFTYLAAGYQAFILRYSVREHNKWPNPLNDYEQAMAFIRSRAKEWHLLPDKIAVVGFSAGGHLAAAAATMSENRPNAAILGYAVTSAQVQACNPTAPDTTPHVDKKTCPCFLFSTRDDGVVHISNSISFLQALADHDIAFESHIYAYGPHGYSTGDPSVQPPSTGLCPRAPQWVQDSIGWLGDVLGRYGDDGLDKPVCKAHTTANHGPFLSVDCTLGHVMKKTAAKPLLDEMLSKRPPGAMIAEGVDILTLLAGTPLRSVLGFAGLSDKADQLDALLKKIPNQ